MWKYQISAVDINQNHEGLAAFWTTIQPSVNPILSYKTLQFTNPIALSLSLAGASHLSDRLRGALWTRDQGTSAQADCKVWIW